jgi:hypothetical protein
METFEAIAVAIMAILIWPSIVFATLLWIFV